MAGAVAFLFPGQASQYAGMGRDLCEGSDAARAVFAEADDALGTSISSLCFSGPDTELSLTENTQPAILAVSIAAFRAAAAVGMAPDFVAGHSLGEYSALVAASSLAFADAIRLVRARGQFMQQAVPIGEGAMAAILGLDAKSVEALCVEAGRGDVVVPANYNAPDQTVVAGHADAVRRAVALAEARGAKRAIMLPVSAPFHSPLMEPARARLQPVLEATTFNALTTPIVTNVDAALVRTGDAARGALSRQVVAPVRWTDCVARLLAEGVTTFVEVGPGRVLLGLVRKAARSAVLLNIEDCKSLDATLTALRSTSA